jgi:hypothetical protein
MSKERDRVRVRHWMKDDEYELAKSKAKECGLPFSRYAVKCMLGKKTVANTDLHYINTLAKLGGLQNKLTGELRDQFGSNDEKINEIIGDMRKIYREIHNTIRAMKNMQGMDTDE